MAIAGDVIASVIHPHVVACFDQCSCNYRAREPSASYSNCRHDASVETVTPAKRLWRSMSPSVERSSATVTAMMTDDELAADLAQRAGELLVELRHELADAEVQHRKDEGDRQAHEFLMHALAQARPGDAVLSEEGQDNQDRLAAERVWIIDPLDGTREFGEIPRTDWAVHVALTAAGQPVAGAVALPALDITLATGTALVAPAPPTGALRVIASRSRPGPAAQAVVDALDGELLLMGSAGAKAMAVVRGEADVYAHTGGQYEWDNCAPVAVARAAGLHASRIDGSPLVYNNEDPYLPDLLICQPTHAEAVLAALAAAGVA